MRPDTVTRRFGRILLGPVLTFLLAPLYRDVVDLDLAGTLGDSLAPLLVYSSVEDELLPPEDAAPVRAAVERAGGRWVDGPGSGMLLSTMHMKKHVQLAMTGRSLMPNEAEILREWLPPSPDVATRLQHVLSKFSEDELTRVRNASRGLSALQDMVAVRRNDNPTHLAALALTNNRREGNLQLLDMLRQDRTGWLDEVSLDEMQLRLDMSDPAGAVPVSRVRALLDMLKPWRAGGHAEDPLAALTQVVEWTRGLGIAGMTEVSRNMTPPQLGYSYSLDLRSSLWNRVARDDLSDADVARLVQRVLLKAIGLQERVVIDEQGRMLIEVSLPDGPRRIDPETVLKSAQP